MSTFDMINKLESIGQEIERFEKERRAWLEKVRGIKEQAERGRELWDGMSNEGNIFDRIRDLASSLLDDVVEMEQLKTVWIEDTDGFWECQGCGLHFVLEAESPEKNEIGYCPRCGRVITEFKRPPTEEAQG